MTINSLVFVYGSLRKGFHNHRVLFERKSSFLGAASTVKPCLMLGGGAFPYLIDPDQYTTSAGAIGRVRGEVYDVDDETMAALDRLEGHPDFYKRVEVEVEPEDHPEIVRAWVYFLQHDPAEMLSPIVMPDAAGFVEWTVERAYGVTGAGAEYEDAEAEDE